MPVDSQPVPDIIFTQVPAKEIYNIPVDRGILYPGDKYVKNCRIVILRSSTGKLLNLTPEFYSAADPDLSFDGNFIIFAGKKEAGDHWQIWQMRYDGSEKTQITKEEGNCVMPVYAGSRFYLDDPKPVPQIVYAGTAHNWRNNFESGHIFSLYACDYTGTTIHRLTFNLYSDFSPDVLPNGRIVFSSLQFSGRDNAAPGKLAFFAVNNDGTDLMPFFGNHQQPRYKNDIHISVTDDRVYFIESGNADIFGGGNIARISQRRPLHSYQKVTKAANGFYYSPCPLPGDDLLVSFRTKSPDDAYALYTLDLKSGEKKRVYKTSGWHSIDAQISVSYPVVKGRSNWLIPDATTGVFYCLNSYQSNRSGTPEINNGDFKYVRVLEGLPAKKERQYYDLSEVRKPDFVNLNPVRILGVAPVEKDGSFNIRVPAKTPLTFQMLDENKMTIDRQETWTWVMGNENRGCIGCHEDREMSPVNRLVNALTKEPVDLTGKAGNRRTVDFRRHIAPLIRENCSTSQCHIAGKSGLSFEKTGTELSDLEIYKKLLGPADEGEDAPYVFAGYARNSPLVWHLYGKRLVEDETLYSKDVFKMPPEHKLSKEDILLITEWIDLGAHWNLEPADYDVFPK